jgi:predicted NBD/HSP70 family sugar kinase
MRRRVLVVDVGGTNVKLHVTGRRDVVKIPSGPKLTPRRMVAAIGKEAAARGWEFDAISLGVPAPVVRGKIIREPAHLGRGWTRFDFARATRKPLRIVNDAAMQALGSYTGGTMLFLGFGTGLGSALIVDGVLVPMELARLPYRNGELEDHVGQRALERYGKRRWRRNVGDVIERIAAACVVDEVVCGGGNSRLLKELPEGTRLGSNACAALGGERLWRGSSGASRFEAASRRPRGRAGTGAGLGMSKDHRRSRARNA